jgi:hypothetical protein
MVTLIVARCQLHAWSLLNRSQRLIADAQHLAFEDNWHWGPSAEETYR